MRMLNLRRSGEQIVRGGGFSTGQPSRGEWDGRAGGGCRRGKGGGGRHKIG